MTETEERVKATLEMDGWRVYKHGFPDFMAFKDGAVRFLEVKSTGDKLRPEQAVVIQELELAGMACNVVYPEIVSKEMWLHRHVSNPARRRHLNKLSKRRYRAKQKAQEATLETA